jgi:hypothetical protein
MDYILMFKILNTIYYPLSTIHYQLSLDAAVARRLLTTGYINKNG